jgi:hypothetical protein
MPARPREPHATYGTPSALESPMTAIKLLPLGRCGPAGQPPHGSPDERGRFQYQKIADHHDAGKNVGYPPRVESR